MINAPSTDLLPGNAPKTASVFSCLAATCALRKARRCGRNDLSDKGYLLSDCAERCHCGGDRLTITDKCEARSMVDMVVADGEADVARHHHLSPGTFRSTLRLTGPQSASRLSSNSC